MDIRTLIVDDEPDIRTLLRLAISGANHGLCVVGEAAQAIEAMDMIHAADPDVVVLDEMMPGMNGIEAAASILRMRPSQKVILFTAYLDDDLRARARATGITRCVAKDRIHELPELIREIAVA